MHRTHGDSGHDRDAERADAVDAADVRRYVSTHQADWLSRDPGGALVDEIDGTLVFADLSGFTPLSERLARRGTAGAEELTDLINSVMGALLAITVPFGADVLTYGGDSLLLLLDGENHELRAAAAAAGMQAAMRAFRRHRSESAVVTLRMSVGVEAGPVHLFLVGASHRPLVVAGPVVSAVVALEHDAGPGEVLLGPRVTAALAPGDCGGPKGSGVLLRRAPIPPPSVPRASGRLTPNGTPPTLLRGIAVGLRSHLGRADGEHRLATVGFVEHRGVDELVAAGRARDAAAALDHLVASTQTACETHGVTFLNIDVDMGVGKLTLVAGVPTTAASDEDRLLAAVTAIVNADTPLALRAGVHRGRLFAVEVGDDRRRLSTILGDAVNLAARVMAAAPPGRVLVTDSTWERMVTPYDRTPIAPFIVKGKTQPVRASLAGPVVDAPHRNRGREEPLVGRDPELALLVRTVRAPAEGRFAGLELIGDAGIGKSRLLAAALTAAPPVTTIVVEGTQYGSNQPYRALREPLRDFLGAGIDDNAVCAALGDVVRRLAPELEPYLPLVAVPFGATLPDTDATRTITPALRGEQIQLRTLQLLDRVLPARGVLVVEDAYWLDGSSGDLLSRVVDFLGRSRTWAVVVASRPVPSPLDLDGVDGVRRIELGPLDAVAAAEVAGHLVAAAAPDVMASLVERSGGNPLYLRELAAAVARGSSVEELPDSIEGVIAASIDAVPPIERSLMRAAAVLGSRFPTRLLAALVEEPEPLLVHRLAGRLIELDGEQMRFNHHLVRQAAYEGLSFKRRRALHGRTAELIEHFAGEAAEAAAGQLALHNARAAKWPEAWRWARLAADRALAAGSNVEALALFEEALDAGRRAEVDRFERAHVHMTAADAAVAAGRPERALDLVASGRRLAAGDPVCVLHLLRVTANATQLLGRYRSTIATAARMRRLAESLPADEAEGWRRRADYAEATARIGQGHAERARPLLEGIVAWDGRDDLVAGALTVLEADPAWTGLTGGALERYERAGNAYGIANACTALGMDAYYRGRWSESADHYRRAQAAAAQAGTPTTAAIARMNTAELLLEQGHLDQAEQELDETLATLRFATDHRAELYTRALSARVAAHRGRFEEADAAFVAIIEDAASTGSLDLVSDASVRRVEALVLAGKSRDALDALTSLGPVVPGPGALARRERLRGCALAQLGDYPTALGALQASLDAAEADGAQYEAALAREAIVRVRTAAGEDAPPDPQAAATLDSLGVVWTPLPPAGHLPARLYRG